MGWWQCFPLSLSDGLRPKAEYNDEMFELWFGWCTGKELWSSWSHIRFHERMWTWWDIGRGRRVCQTRSLSLDSSVIERAVVWPMLSRHDRTAQLLTVVTVRVRTFNEWLFGWKVMSAARNEWFAIATNDNTTTPESRWSVQKCNLFRWPTQTSSRNIPNALFSFVAFWESSTTAGSYLLFRGSPALLWIQLSYTFLPAAWLLRFWLAQPFCPCPFVATYKLSRFGESYASCVGGSFWFQGASNLQFQCKTWWAGPPLTWRVTWSWVEANRRVRPTSQS